MQSCLCGLTLKLHCLSAAKEKIAIMTATVATVSTVVTASFSTEADVGSRSSKVSLLELSM